jgi:hypothetical protein
MKSNKISTNNNKRPSNELGQRKIKGTSGCSGEKANVRRSTAEKKEERAEFF